MLRDILTKNYFAARDAAGTIPLYYTIQDGIFYHSSDISELFKFADIKKEPDIESMNMLLYYGTIDYSATMYKGIKRLPPGHSMTVDENANVQIERYWKPEDITINRNINEEEAKEKFLEIFQQAIEECVDNFSTTAFDLSGGLDSSSIVTLAKYKYPHMEVNSIQTLSKPPNMR